MAAYGGAGPGVIAAATYEAAVAALAGGATVLTGSPRLARRVLGDEAIARSGAGETVWERGDALAWSAWLKRQHADALACGAIEPAAPSVLLTPAQADALWQRIIEQGSEDYGLLQPTVAARHAAEAHALCAAWHIDVGALRAGRHHEDAAVFLQWADAFDRTLARNGWLVAAQLPERLPAWMAQRPDLRPRALYLVGLDVITPQQQWLLDQLDALDVAVFMVGQGAADDRSVSAAVGRFGCGDPDGERSAAVRWARARLENDPDARLAIIVPDLAGARAALARELDATLDPSVLSSSAPRLRRPWNIALGWSLADEPLIHDALMLLGATAGVGTLEFAAASRLLRSPFIGGAEGERGARLALERFLRDRREAECTLSQMARWAVDGKVLHETADVLAARVSALLDTARSAGGRLGVATWAEHFAAQLRAIGWPGERGLDSREHQALGGWQEVLAEFAALACVSPRLPREAALRMLRRIAADRNFQPQSLPAPVQVLGLHDALGQTFDGAWLLGMDDETWPAAPRPNPFLPTDVQREAGVPQASASGQLAHADAVTKHLLVLAPEVVVSWARRRDDRNLRVSPLMTHLPEVTPHTWAVTPWRVSLLDAGDFEYCIDVQGPPLLTGGTMRGGTSVFRDQSKCPFRAFAMHRLGASELSSPAPGLDALDRGGIVHRVLHAMWKRLKSRSALAALSEAECAGLLASWVDSELAQAARDRPLVFTPRFTAVERQCLVALLMQWRESELARDDFRVVETEQTVLITTQAAPSTNAQSAVDGGGSRSITVRARVDRIDELADGRRVLIDYKTGGTHPSSWLGLRPDEPQMPLYSALFGDELAAVVYARVRIGHCEWRGVSREDTELPGVAVAGEWKAAQERGWTELRAEWRAAAQSLTAAFLAGAAAPDPLRGACDYCQLSALCRIDELRGGFARDAATAGDSDDER